MLFKTGHMRSQVVLRGIIETYNAPTTNDPLGNEYRA
jgi:hypothetical protein